MYREGIFQPRLTDLDVQYLGNDPAAIQVRWMELSDTARKLLSDMAEIVRDMDTNNTLLHLEPIDVARGLVSIYDRLPTWVSRTQKLSQNAKQVRQLFKQASDPNRFIFDDIPNLFHSKNGEGAGTKGAADVVRIGLTELRAAYPNMLHRLQETLLSDLGVPSASPQNLAELRARARNVRQLGGDLRLEAFILRISQFQGNDSDIESLASMAANKPPSQWVDSDIDRTAVEMASLARSFNRLEAFAHVKGRPDHRQAIAVVVGFEGEPIHGVFEVTEHEQGRIDQLADKVRLALTECNDKERNVILGVLAQVAAEFLEGNVSGDDSEMKRISQ